MRALPLILLASLAVAACGRSEKAEAPPASPPPPAKDGTAPPTIELTEAGLRRVCRAGIAAVHGQQIEAVTIAAVREGIADATWRAPVDGGARRAQCRVDGDMIVWKPLDRPDEAQNRWMNQAGDPLVRFVVTAREITITTTLPDGAVSAETFPVAAEPEEEAA
ncbi:MAG TPA: hypothetical protein VGR32_11105 [Brevundimonas sp.]|uniref:hypothetical protein n=1 Tax=Brevundimonas sp. TaxID=1871086 RepID=UPI002DEAEDB3|nr:hypothetical protein [Brevundimonas sp.]